MKQISDELSLSRTTVYRVIQGSPRVDPETRRRVLEAIERYDYRPNSLARNLALRRAGAIGLILDSISSPIWDHLTDELIARLNADSFAVNLRVGYGTRHDRVYHYLEDDVISRRVDALLFKYPYPYLYADEFAKTREKVDSLRVPVVFLSRVPDEESVDYVSTDRTAGARAIVQHLHSRGRRRIRMITVRESGASSRRMGRDKEIGFESALQKLGEPVDDTIYFVGHGYGYRDGYEAGNEIASLRPLPDAVFCTSDAVALGLLMRLRKDGIRIPDDVAVAGFNDDEHCEISPTPLTTVAQPVDEIADHARRLVVERLSNPVGDREQLLIAPRLVVRNST